MARRGLRVRPLGRAMVANNVRIARCALRAPWKESAVRGTRSLVSYCALLVVACGSPAEDPRVPADSAERAEAPGLAATQALLADAEALRDSAKAVLATLLDDPASARFDSLAVIRPPVEDERPRPLAVCGRIGGSPGIAGSRGMTRFVYQNRWTVFVEERANREQFAALWAKSCAGERTVVL